MFPTSGKNVTQILIRLPDTGSPPEEKVVGWIAYFYGAPTHERRWKYSTDCVKWSHTYLGYNKAIKQLLKKCGYTAKDHTHTFPIPENYFTDWREPVPEDERQRLLAGD